MDADKVGLTEPEMQENGFESEVDDDDEDDVQHAIQFKDMIFEVVDRVEKARKDEEYTKMEKADWDQHWQNIFDKIRRDIAADERFPVAITNPPVYKVELRCTEKRDPMCCPCGFDRESLPLLKIEVSREQPQGVTKDLLVAKICEALHGTKDAPARIGEEHDKMVLDGVDWMITCGSLMYDTIFLYCPGMTMKPEYESRS